MKAQAFLELVGKMMTKQQDYFTAKRQGLIKAKDLLIEAKELEKQVRAVVKEGRLEPDELTAVQAMQEAFPAMFVIDAPVTQLEKDLMGNLDAEDNYEGN